MLKDVEQVPKPRLVPECQMLGLECYGSRSDLINRLKTSGVYRIHADLPPCEKEQNTFNCSNILLGNVPLSCDSNHVFKVQSSKQYDALLEGNLKENSITMPKVMKLKESEFDVDTKGEEGELRRSGSELYMYRETNVYAGWYPLLFGSVKII